MYGLYYDSWKKLIYIVYFYFKKMEFSLSVFGVLRKIYSSIDIYIRIYF